MTTLDRNNISPRLKKTSARVHAYYFYVAVVLMAILAASVLVTAQAQAHAQSAHGADTPFGASYL